MRTELQGLPSCGLPESEGSLLANGSHKPFHREQFPLDGVMGLIQQGAGHRHLRVFEHRIPARLLLLEPAPYALAVGRPAVVATWSAKWRSRWPSANTRKPLRWRARYSRVWNCERKALRTGDAIATSFFGSLLMRVAEAVAEACTREQRPHTLGRAVEAIGQDASDPIRRLLLGRRTLKLPIGLGKGRRTGVLGVAQVPDAHGH